MRDVEMLQSVSRALDVPTVDNDTLGLEAIAEIPSGGHFFGHAHTMARYERAFYSPLSGLAKLRTVGGRRCTRRTITREEGLDAGLVGARGAANRSGNPESAHEIRFSAEKAIEKSAQES